MFDMCGGPPDPLDSDSFPTSIWILSVSVKPSNFNDLADSELLIDSDRQGYIHMYIFVIYIYIYTS